MSGGCLENVWRGARRVFGWCLDGVKTVSAGYLESVGMASGRCLEDILKASGGYFECVCKVRGYELIMLSNYQLQHPFFCRMLKISSVKSI